MHLCLCMQVYICVHDEGREILGSVKLGRGEMMVWKAKLEETNMRPEKDLLPLSVEEHGLDSGDARSLLYGINRADVVGSSWVERVGAWAGWVSVTRQRFCKQSELNWTELKGVLKERAKETGRTGLCPGLVVQDYYYPYLQMGKLRHKTITCPVGSEQSVTQPSECGTMDPSLFEVESALHSDWPVHGK